MFEGSYVAIVTPFKNGKVDAAALKGLIEFHVENGTKKAVTLKGVPSNSFPNLRARSSENT